MEGLFILLSLKDFELLLDHIFIILIDRSFQMPLLLLNHILFIPGMSLLVLVITYCKVAVNEESDRLVYHFGYFTLVRYLLNDLDMRQLFRVHPNLVQGVVRLVGSRANQPSNLTLLYGLCVL